MHIRFFNTFEPVSSFYRDLLPHLVRGENTIIEIFISAAAYRDGRNSLFEAVSHPRIHIRQIGGLAPFGQGRFRKLTIMLSYAAISAINSLTGSKADLNFFLSQPPLFAIWGWILQKIRKQPYCYLIMDLYPDVMFQAGIISATSRIGRLLSKLSRTAILKADGVFVIGRCMRDRLIAAGVAPNKMHFIPNWADERRIYPTERAINPLRKSLGLQRHFIVLYSGNMGASHYFSDILTVAERLKNVDRIRFVFIGAGYRREEIVAKKSACGLDNILLLPYQDLERISTSLGLGDVHFVSLRSGFEGLVVPSKAYAALAVGRPIIYQGSAKGEIARVVSESDCGAVVPQPGAVELERAILDYFKNTEKCRRHGLNAAAAAKYRFDRQGAVATYARIVDGITGDRSCN